MSPLVLRRLARSVLLLAYVFYALRLAPPDDPPGASFSDLAQGHGLARNPAIFAVFNLLGVLPLLYWALLLPDGRGQKLWAGPFALEPVMHFEVDFGHEPEPSPEGLPE